MKKYYQELRIYHYVKNLLVFIPLICSGCFFNASKLIPAIFGFLAFCVISSATYIINDIRDIEKDRNHPTKKNRPIASGAISIKKAWIVFGILIILGVIFNCHTKSLISLLFLGLYLALNIAYSFGLKNTPILDVTILVSGFLLRVLYGASITGIEVSNWLYLTVITLSFFLSLGKRRNELRKLKGAETRSVLKNYTDGFLDKNMYICLALTNTFYALWAIEKQGMDGLFNSYIIWTVPLVIIILMKYSLAVEGNSDGDPVEVLKHDKVLIVLCLLYGLIMGFILYGGVLLT